MIGWEGVVALMAAIGLATRYHLGKIKRNTKIAKKAIALDKRFILKKDFTVKFFCRVINKFRYFAIKKGTVVLCAGRYCLVRLCTSPDLIPETIVINHGTDDADLFIFRISKKRLADTTGEFIARGFIIKE